ncbi:tetratricopeptide repeat protein [uncultured Thiodictyon sp.]|uniref:tetratricopeptide repeat protein n=1 Tax=uncultured Thiodictyon sp. TaxID=1846217 RepID=UPI0025ECEDF9|nr:tetratricopeptide repeat protein [uncultured Thiodictyon sp.]
MTDIDVIALYGPGNLSPDDLVAGFVARETTLNHFLGELRHQTEPGASPRHHLIIGQRGMGKTTLLLRIAIAVGEQPGLAARLVPLTFREEQYNVINLHVFWRNASESLLDWLEQAGHQEDAQALESALDAAETAYEKDRKAEAGGGSAWRAFRQGCERLGRRPVLFLDNLNLILDALKKHAWGLRDLLQQTDGPLVIGAAAAYPKGLSDRTAAFFDFFRITTLERLQIAEVRACLHRLAGKRGPDGAKVAALLGRDPGRIDALTEMTGGNPRTLALLYLLLESQAGEDAFADLEQLLDRMTPLYKARAEEAAPQARAVLDAVALAWDPIIANEVARESGLEVTVVNAQLARLENDGYVEKVEVSGSGRSGYQMVERFFNIWYLMRHGSRRLKQRVRWLTCFLRGFYSPGDREGLARDVLSSGNHRGRADLMAALSESMDDPVYRKALSHAAGRDLVQQSETRERIGHLVDLRDIDPEQADMVELKRRVLAMQREWPNGMDARGFWDLLGGSLEIGGAQKRRVVELLPTIEADRLAALTETLRNELAELCAAVSLSEHELGPYRAAVRDGSIGHCYDLEGASAAALHENTPGIAAMGCLVALNTANSDPDQVRATRKRFAGDGDRLWARVDGHSDIEQSDTPLRAYHRGRRLEELGFPADAESSLRKGGEMEFDNEHRSWAWGQLGYYLNEKWGRYEEAEGAYRQAVTLDPKDALPWHNLGGLLQEHLGRYEEAEAAYRQAITLDPNFAWPWNNLGDLLQEHLGRCEEAEAAFRQAIVLDPKDALPWNNLGTLLQDELGRHEEAEQAYLRSLELAEPKKQGYPHGHLAYLYWFHLNRPEDARQHAELGRQVPEDSIGRLLDAAQHLAEDSPGPAFAAFDAALAKGDAQLWSTFLLRVQRTLRYAHAKGYGPQFCEWMEAADYPARYAPLYWAFLALLEGEDILRNVSPEVRRTAERIYRGLAVGAKPPTAVKKARRRRPPR